MFGKVRSRGALRAAVEQAACPLVDPTQSHPEVPRRLSLRKCACSALVLGGRKSSDLFLKPSPEAARGATWSREKEQLNTVSRGRTSRPGWAAVATLLLASCPKTHL